MSNIAPPTRTIGDVVTLVETTGQTVHHGSSEQKAEPPFYVIEGFAPVQLGEGLAAEDWGTMAGRWRVIAYGQTEAQAEWLLWQAAEVAWGRDWSADFVNTVAFRDPTPNMPDYGRAFVVREVDHGVYVPPVASKVIWNDAGDFETWNDAGDFTLWT